MDWISQNDEDRREEAAASRELLRGIQQQLDDTNETVTALPDMVRGMFIEDAFEEGALAEVTSMLETVLPANTVTISPPSHHPILL
jgi:hypothetical protein